MADQIPTYRAAPVTQRDGSSLANSNCRMASIATGLDYETRGAKRSTGAKMRTYTDDQSGGTDSGDARQSWDRGYGESLAIGDGGTWSDVLERLRQGRLVHLDVWHATVDGAGICHSGSGAYGHTIAVAPDLAGSSWLVADPWCSPPKWGRVAESELRAGAEEWGGRVFLEATGGRPAPEDPEELRRILAAAARRLMSRSYPGHERPIREADTGGAQPVLFTYTHAQPLEGSDMGIYWNPTQWNDPGIPLYLDSACTRKVTSTEPGGVLQSLGPAAAQDENGMDADSYAILVTTTQLRTDGTPTRAILWAKRTDLPDDTNAPDQAWDDSLWALAFDIAGRYPCPGEDELVEARDAEWIDALTGGDPWPRIP